MTINTKNYSNEHPKYKKKDKNKNIKVAKVSDYVNINGHDPFPGAEDMSIEGIVKYLELLGKKQ